MKSAERNVETIMERAVTRHGNLSQRDVDSAMDHAWKNLQPDIANAQDWAIASGTSRSIAPSRVAFAFAAAAALASFLLIPVLLHRVHASATVESGDGKFLQVGQKIEAGKIVSSSGTGSVLRLADGSHVEMRAGAALSVERTGDGVRIRLHQGSVIVNAAKQGKGHLYVQTKDMTASVVGTVFLVNAETEGSRVAVIQGEVHVQQGATLEKLLPGEQATTSPSLEPFPVADEITWSRDTVKHVALLRQAVSASSRTAGAKEFEVASIRVSPPGVPLENSGGSYSPGRFHAKNLSLKELIQVAYQLDGFQLSGGPSWMNTDRYIVEAKAEGNVDRDQINQMLQALLVKRFNLKLHRDFKESSIYELALADGGLRLGEPQQAGIEDRRVSGPMRHHPEFLNVSVPELASILGTLLRTSVVDKTGINGRFNFKLSYTPDGKRNGEPDEDSTSVDGDSLFTAIQNQLGLKLQSVKGKVEVLVVESADKPTEN